MKTTWILVSLLVVLVGIALVTRERFTLNPSPQCPDGFQPNRAGSQCTNQAGETQSPTCPNGYVFVNLGGGGFCSPPELASATEATCPEGSILRPSSDRNDPSVACRTERGTVVEATCPAGSTLNTTQGMPLCVPAATPPASTSDMTSSAPVSAPASTSDMTSSAPVSAPAPLPLSSVPDTMPSSPPVGSDVVSGMTLPTFPGASGLGAVSGTSTGGTSGMTFGPTNPSKLKGQTVWGPASKGLGEAVAGAPTAGDSTKSTPYPVLLGGESGKSSTRVEGVGIVPPSGSGLGGILPSSAALGTDANSGFLPYSRQPGDQELIPDPYRLATNFSTSSYSASKTDPVPFLTDFSAFYK